MPPNPSEDTRPSADRHAIDRDEDEMERFAVMKDKELRAAARRTQQDEPGPIERRQRGGARRGL